MSRNLTNNACDCNNIIIGVDGIIILTDIATSVVDANATSATVSWRYKKQIYDSTSCRNWWVESVVTREIPLTHNASCEENYVSGSITWKGNTLKYKITQKAAKCDDCSCDNLTITMCEDIIDVWLDNPIFKCGEEDNGKRTLSYTYPQISYGAKPYYEIITASTNVTISADCDTVIDPITLTSSTTIPSFGDVAYSYKAIPSTKCKNGEVRLQLSRIEYDSEMLPPSGGSVNGNIFYRVYVYDDNCKSTNSEYLSSFTWNIDACECDSMACCNDHYETSSLTISYPYIIDDVQTSATLDVNLSMLIVGDDGTYCDKCKEPSCLPYTTYIIDQDSAVAYYKRYNKETKLYEWYSGGTLQQSGGEIKAKYNYSAITQDAYCVSSTTTYSDFSYVINIPPIECDANSATTITSGTSATTKYGIIDNFTYKQEQNKCGEEPKTTTVTGITYSQPSNVPCNLTSSSAISIDYETYEYVIDEYGNIISGTQESGVTEINVYFGDEENCGNERLISAFTQSGFSIFQDGGCVCPIISGNTLDVDNPPSPLVKTEDGNWIIPCCITGEVWVKIEYLYIEYEFNGTSWYRSVERKIKENKKFENVNIGDSPQISTEIPYHEFERDSSSGKPIPYPKTLTIKDVGNCCSILNITCL